MSEVLKAYTEFDTDELAVAVHELVSRHTKQLKHRRLLGVVARYGSDLDMAKAKIEKGQQETAYETLHHFAIVRSDGSVAGQASLFPNLPLSRVRLPINPRLLPSWLVDTRFDHANPNISAWEADGNSEQLAAAYRELRTRAWQPILANGVRDIAWTLEPSQSPHYAHQAIEKSGMERINTRFYYDGEPGLLTPASVLYAATLGNLTASGRLQELRTGDWHGSEAELMSRNPGTF